MGNEQSGGTSTTPKSKEKNKEIISFYSKVVHLV
jgi:hypothetical protein